MKIKLTTKQMKQLTPFFDRVRATAALGSPGMLLAQIKRSPQDGTCWMEPGFLPHENALCIAEKAEQLSLPAPVPKRRAARMAQTHGQTLAESPADGRATVSQAR